MKPAENSYPDAHILVIDDNIENVRLAERFLEWANYTNVQCMTNSAEALQLLKTVTPDLILLDLHMPKPDGYEILNQVRAARMPLCSVPVLVFTADVTRETRAKALEAGASDFLTKPGDAQEILLRVHNFLVTRHLHHQIELYSAELENRVEERTAELNAARQEALESLARAAELRDDDTGQHTQRVGEMSERIARQMGRPEEFARAIRLAAPLHDVGKIGITDSILLKPGKLEEGEVETMRGHTIIGGRVFEGSQSPLMTLAREIAMNHHERWDGAGYPNRLYRDQIPLSARIVAVADVFDALTNERPYKPAWSEAEAIAEIASQRGKHFDPAVVDAFVALMTPSRLRQAA